MSVYDELAERAAKDLVRGLTVMVLTIGGLVVIVIGLVIALVVR